MRYTFLYFIEYEENHRLRVENETQLVKSRLHKWITLNKSEIKNRYLHTRTDPCALKSMPKNNSYKS